MAPEILDDSFCQGSQKGDVFAFGIICQEVMQNDLPFANNHPFLTPKEIVKMVKERRSPPYRPSIDAGMLLNDNNNNKLLF